MRNDRADKGAEGTDDKKGSDMVASTYIKWQQINRQKTINQTCDSWRKSTRLDRLVRPNHDAGSRLDFLSRATPSHREGDARQ